MSFKGEFKQGDIAECPHCQSEEGFYAKYQYRGSGIVRFNYDGSNAENGDMYDFLNEKESKYVYCLNCEKRLFKMEDIHSEIKV